MHKKILLRFNRLEKKYGKEFSISKNQLHLLIQNKIISEKKFTLIGFFSNLILLFLSLVSIFFCRFNNIKIANYFIVQSNSPENYDNRSKYVLENFNFKKSMNIVRCKSFVESLRTFFYFPNVVFYMPFDYFNNFFIKRDNKNKIYESLHKKEMKNFIIFKKIFIFVKISKFISIDDQRVIQLFLKICKELNIKSYGYMHYKFSKFVIGIKYLPFDNFFVWSNYFKKKLIEVNQFYKYKKIYISGYPKKKIQKYKNKKINVLYIIDLNLNINKTKKILSKLNKNDKIKLFLKLKPQNISDNTLIDFCNKEKIEFFEKESFDFINKKIKMDYFIATVSTALLESTLYGALPIKLITENDFADDLIKDKVVLKAKKLADILKIVKKKPSQNLINSIFKMVWGKKKYKSAYIEKIISKQIY